MSESELKRKNIQKGKPMMEGINMKNPPRLYKASRQYRHNNSDEFVAGSDYKETSKVDSSCDRQQAEVLWDSLSREERRVIMNKLKSNGHAK